MAGYTKKWKCRNCQEMQETIDTPKINYCDKCVGILFKIFSAHKAPCPVCKGEGKLSLREIKTTNDILKSYLAKTNKEASDAEIALNFGDNNG